MRIGLIICLLMAAFLGRAQSPSDWWYFGQYAGVHFTTSGPVADTNGALLTSEGCATLSSGEGDLMFYTDGLNVWDSTHNQMPNGFGLLGNGSSTQSGVIVPYPGNPDLYYIFAVRGCTGTAGGMPNFLFSYSIVDMNLNGGLGDIDTSMKNIVLFDSAAEKITAVLHDNGSDIWVIGREEGQIQFHAYQLSSAGVVDTVTTTFSGIPMAFQCIGYMLANHAGDMLACSWHSISTVVELFPFDQATGIVSAPDTVDPGVGFPYGVHFSPNDELLYVGAIGGGLWQYDLTVANPQASAFQVTTADSRAIAEGPDEKLYVTRYGQPYLQTIHDPDVYGAGCNHQDSAVYLEGRICYYGLPNNVGAAVFSISDILTDGRCLGDTTYLSIDTNEVDSLKWNFGDPTIGPLNTSEDFFPGHVFTDTGEFTIMVIAYSDTLPIIDTAFITIRIYPRQSIDLGPDTVLCFGDTLNLSASQPYAMFEWSNLETTDSIQVSNEGNYSVTVLGFCDTVMDSIYVSFDDTIQLDLGLDTTVCGADSYLIVPALALNQNWIYWSVDSFGDSLWVFETDTIVAEAGNVCGLAIDTIAVILIPIPANNILPSDTINCFDSPIILAHPNEDEVVYYWSDSTSKSTYQVDTTELVWLSASNECGFSVDSINIIFNGEIQTELGEDTTICDDDSLLLTTNDSLAIFIWNSGDSVDSVWTIPGETFNYIVTITLRDCELREQREVVADELVCPTLDCTIRFDNIFTPNGDGINDRFRINSDCNIFSYSLAIYNRWGQLVHYTINPAFGWDGFINGEQAAEGTYFYKLEYKDDVVVNVDRYVFQGSFTLKR